jgi:hypothetical protein
MNIVSDVRMNCVIQDEGAMGSTYPLYVANSTVILFTFTNEMFVTSNYPQITSLGSEYLLNSSTLTTWLPNCALNAGFYLIYNGNYIPNYSTLYRYMELKSSSGYSYTVVYPATTPFQSPSPSTPSYPPLVISYNAITIADSGVWVDMYLAWGTGSSYTKVTAGLELCDDGTACGGSWPNYCFLKSSAVIVNSTTYYDPTPSIHNVSQALKPLDVLAKHPVKSFKSINTQEYVNMYVLCHDVTCI